MSEINPIEWHEECLKNKMENLIRERQELELKQSTYDKKYRDAWYYRVKILMAVNRGEGGLDGEEFQ